MRKNTYKKTDGKIPDNMPFKKGDIITCVEYRDGKVVKRDVILLDNIDGDNINAFSVFHTVPSWNTEPSGRTTIKIEDGYKLRYSLNYEMKAFINALAKRAQ